MKTFQYSKQALGRRTSALLLLSTDWSALLLLSADWSALLLMSADASREQKGEQSWRWDQCVAGKAEEKGRLQAWWIQPGQVQRREMQRRKKEDNVISTQGTYCIQPVIFVY